MKFLIIYFYNCLHYIPSLFLLECKGAIVYETHKYSIAYVDEGRITLTASGSMLRLYKQ